MKKVIVSVTNDLVTDQRVGRLCASLVQNGFELVLVGRKLPNSPELQVLNYKCVRMNLIFKSSAFFYAEYNFRLFLFLLFHRFDILVSNDLDTLLANYTVWKLKGGNLIYDSHEYFTGVPELESNPFAKKVWTFLEKKMIPKLKFCFTVNQSIADLYKKQYGIEFKVLRNMPYKIKQKPAISRQELGIPETKKMILLQGNGINIQRGAEEAVEAMKYLKTDAILYIIGSGDVIQSLKEYVHREKLHEKVKFIDRLPFNELLKYTTQADLGLSLDKPNSLNYQLSLPNKIFDYIQAQVPVLCTNLPETSKIINDFEVGECIHDFSSQNLAKTIDEIFSNPKKVEKWKNHLPKAAEILCREEEEKEILELFERLK